MKKRAQEFTMETGKIVAPFTADWFRTVSFGDVLKLLLFVGGVTAGYIHLTDRVSTIEGSIEHTVNEIRESQKDNSIAWERRFQELATRDEMQRQEFAHQIERLADRLDGYKPHAGP